MLVTLTTSLTPVLAQQASSDIKTTINGLLTSYVPSVTQTTTTSGDVTFTHPGIGMSKAMLDNMRDHVRAADEPWASAFVQFSKYGKSSTSPVIRVSTSNNDYMNIPGGGSGSVGHTIIKNMEQDADTSFAQMIMWYITGNETYRQNAIRIIRDWSQCQSIGSIFDEQIRVSLAVYKFSFTADLLRYSDTPTSAYMWTSSDTTNFTNFLALMESKYDRYWHFMNQHTFTLMGTMGSAIFRNDPSDYQNAIKRITTNPELGSSYDYTDPENPHNRGGSIKDQIRAVTKNVKTGETVPENIQLVEMGRDQPHSYADIGGLSTVAMTAYIQGTKVDPSSGEYSAASNSVHIFNFLNDRILYGANYLSKYNLWNNVTYIPSYSSQISTGQIYESPSTSDRGRIDPGIGIVYSYYRYIEQKSDMDTNENSKYLAQAFTKIYPEGASQDFFGDSVLFYTLSAVKAGKYYKLVNKKSGKALEIKDASTADGGLAIQYGFSGGTNQIWKIESAGSGYYYLTNVNSNKVLEVKDQSTANGAAVDQWSNNGGNHQKWEINDLGNGYYKILNANGGKALDVSEGSTADGASIIQYTYSGGDNQQWMLEEIALGGITGLTATMDGSNAINLSWTAVSLAPGYNIYRSTEKNGSYTQINSSPITSASYSDTGLTPNTIYYYKVEVSGGSQSGVVSATTGGTGVPAFDVSNYELNVNHTHQSVLRVILSDRSSQVFTSQARFTSSDPAVAAVDSAGLVTGISEGTAEITATYNRTGGNDGRLGCDQLKLDGCIGSARLQHL